MKIIRILPLVALLVSVSLSYAQITIVSGPADADQMSLDGTYTQNFDALGSSSGTWSDNLTLPGWYASLSNATAVTPHTAYTASSGGGTTSTLLYSFGASGSSERALGATPSLGNFLVIGLRLVNGTDDIIDALSVTYDGEQWRKNLAASSTITFSYQIFAPGAGSLSTLTGWSDDVPGLTFTTPVANAGTGALDGNESTNRIAGISTVLNSLALQPDEELWLKWTVSKISGENIGLAIDNAIIAIPEPGVLAIAALGLLGLGAYRRCRRCTRN